MNLTTKTVAKYAAGTAPVLGIPMAGVGTAVFLRDHLRAALELQPARITYNQDTREMTFKTARSEWRLKDLKAGEQWQAHLSLLRSWTGGKRKRQAAPRADKQTLYARRLQEAVDKLEKQRAKIALWRPESPINPRQREAGDYLREQCRAWIEDKPKRKAVAWLAGRKLVHGERTWPEFYKAVEAIIGRPVEESQTFARMHSRNGSRNRRYARWCKSNVSGDRGTYLKGLPEYLRMASKPYTWKPYAPDMRAHDAARREYCEKWREVKSLESQIEAHKAEIASAEENKA